MKKILYISMRNTANALYPVIGISKSLLDYFGLKNNSYVSFAQDTRDSKQFYLITDNVDEMYRYCIYKNNTSNSIYNPELENYIYDALDLSKQYNIRFMVSKKPKVIDGIKAYPLILDDYIYKQQQEKPTEDSFREGLKDIRIDKEGRMSLTDLWRLAGRPQGKKPNDWKKRNTSKAIIRQLADKHQTGMSSVLTGCAKRTAGTYAHKTLFLSYAKYIDLQLGSIVEEAFNNNNE